MISGLIRAISPQWALKREQARRVLAYYEAARPSTQRKQRKEVNSASVAIRNAGTSIREQARHLEQNHDLSRSILRVMVNNTVGAHGISVEPTPLLPDGAVHEDFARQLLELWDHWGEAPEVTRQYTWPAVQRILARTKYRDGEVFARFITGAVRHSTDIPLSLELLEADHFPLGYDNEHNGRRIRDAVELNNWGRPIAYWAYRGHPGEWDGSARSIMRLKRIAADNLLHLALRDRLHQRRGMSIFAAILQRLDDLKDYETSESIAAKVAASLGAAIKKGTPDLYNAEFDSDGNEDPRDMRFRPGMIFDDLLPGESIEMIGNNGRPSAQMVDFRDGLLKAATSGVGCSSSTVTRNYDGSYSARRQELVDAWVDYAVLSQDLAAELVRPVYRRVIDTALATGQLTLPRDVAPERAVQAMYQPPVMPWISPKDEANAWLSLERAGLASGPEIVRKRGRSPSDVHREEVLWRQKWKDDGELIETDPATDSAGRNDAQQADASPQAGLTTFRF
jgi:lambda family phage portal protein